VIADDTPFVRDRFKAAIEAAGHRAFTVRSTAELLARVRADLPDIGPCRGGSPAAPRRRGRARAGPSGSWTAGACRSWSFSGTISGASEVRDLANLGIAGYVNEYSASQHILPSLAPHLFPDNFNRRNSPRVPLGIPVAYRFGDTIAAAVTLNLGRGGLAIRT